MLKDIIVVLSDDNYMVNRTFRSIGDLWNVVYM